MTKISQERRHGLRIIQIIGGAERGGSRAHIITLCRGLRRYRPDIEVELICLTDGSVAAEARVNDIPLNIFAMRTSADLGVIAPLREHLRRIAPSIVHTHGVRANFVARSAALGLGCAVATTVHSSMRADYAKSIKRWLFPSVERLTRPWCDHFVAVASCLVEELLADGVPPDRVSLVYNGLPATHVLQASTGQSIRDELGIGAGIPVIVSVGRLERVKDPHTFLRVLAALRNRLPFHGVIVGEGSLRSSLESRAERMGLVPCVSFLGFRRDVARVLEQSEVLISTSKMEGLPLVLLEAMQAGVPVVASDVGGAREVVHLSRNGFLVSQNDTAAYADCVERLLREPDLHAELAANGARALKRYFSTAGFVEGYLDVYNKILRNA